MKLAEYKKMIAGIPTIYDDYKVKALPCDGNYDVEDFSIDDDNKEIHLEP